MIRKELVAYRDGALPERERARVAAHLETCPACTREDAQLAGVRQLFAGLERIAPSPDFAATFWRRLEQEGQVEQESRLAHWWREWQKWLIGWQLAPALVAAASLLIFFGYIISGRPPAPSAPGTENVPVPVVEKPNLFVNYKVLADLDKLMHFEEVVVIESTSDSTAELSEEDLPPQLLENPSFFVHYPLLQKMEQLQNLEAVLDLPGDADQQHRG